VTEIVLIMIPDAEGENIARFPRLKRIRWNQGFVSPRACGETPDPPLKVLKAKADGRCMFRSMAKGLGYIAGQDLGEDLERTSADALREASYQVICVKKRAWWQKMGFVEGDIDTYCKSMRSPDFYGGEPELFVLSETVLKRPVAVYMHGTGDNYSKLLEYGSGFRRPNKQPLRLLYNGVNHYDCLVPIGESTDRTIE